MADPRIAADPCALDLVQAARALADGAVRSEALTEACLDAIARAQPVLQAFEAVTAAPALALARSLDAARAAGQAAGPLAGVPMAHKDMFHRAGTPCGYGSPLRAAFVPDDTAEVIARLDAAGQVPLGRLRMSEFAMGPAGHNAHTPRPCNPWDPARITGGSSSGSGAAVAARLVFGALGSDTGGSVRLPAAICGVFGLKPTQGRVPMAGAMPLSASLDCIGPLARSARDIGRLLDVLCAPAGRFGSQFAAHSAGRFEAAATAAPDGLRLGIPEGYYTDALAPDVAAALEAARATFEGLGLPCCPVAIPDQSAHSDLANILFTPEAATLHLETLRDQPGAYGPQVRARLLQGLTVDAVQYLRAQQLRAVHAAAMHEGPLAQVDALLVPAMRGCVPTAAETDVGAGPQMAATLGALADLTRPISYLGLPALAMPGGFDGNGMPVGLQLVGRAGQEGVLLALAGAFERATDWAAQRPPPMAAPDAPQPAAGQS